MPVTAPSLCTFLRRTVLGVDLSPDEMREVVGCMMDGDASPAQVAALLIALRAKRETAEELVGAAQAMRTRSINVLCNVRPLMDVCGTGGDSSGSFNISTAVAFVVAGAGVAVAKHGNRAMSSHCGSADVFEALGIDLRATAADARRRIERHNFAFLYAQAYHPAMRNVAPVRKELGVPSIFNLLGPLTNPAQPTHQVIGVSQSWAMPAVAQAVRMLGTERAAVICSHDGMDEVALSSATDVLECTASGIRQYTLEPEMFGFARRPLADIAGGNAQQNAAVIRSVLHGASGAHRDIVVLNSALALYVAGKARDLRAGRGLAERSIDSGAAHRVLESAFVTTI